MHASRVSVVCVLLAASGFCLSRGWNRAHLGPRLEISPEIGVGEVDHDDALEMTIGFRNAGDDVLRLEPPIPGCQCAKASLSAAEFAPGEAGTFHFVTQPARPPGTNFVLDVQVPSNDPLARVRTVRVHGRMAGSLIATPSALQQYAVSCGVPWSQEAIVTCSAPGVQFEVTGATCSLAGCTIDGPFPTAVNGVDGSAWLLVVSHTPTEVGATSSEILVTTDHPRYRELRIPLNVTVLSRLTMTPGSVLLTPDSTMNSQRVEITSESPFVVRQPPGLNDVHGLELALQQNAPGGWTALVSLGAGAVVDRARRIEAVLPIEGLDGESELRLPITIAPAHAWGTEFSADDELESGTSE